MRDEKDAWRDGRKYNGVLRAKGSELRIRAFVGVEVLGQTEQLKRVDGLPVAPQCKL